MIVNRENKIQSIIEHIQNQYWRTFETSTGWYFYKRVLDQRREAENIEAFLENSYNIELLYATLATWGLDSRRAKLKYFDDFKQSILNCQTDFEKLEAIPEQYWGNEEYLDLLKQLYANLKVMESNCKLVSNSKLLHFLFPTMLMPIDGAHTLIWLYGNKNENQNKYLEVIRFSFDVMQQNIEWESYLSPIHIENTTKPKLIDNVIWRLAEQQ